MGCKIHHNTVFKYICLSFLPEGISNDYVKSLPSSMLLPEQMGWTFHRVCMKEASTWMLPLEMDKCCRKEHIQLSLLCTTTEICKWQHCDLMSNQQWFNLKRMMSCQLELESLLPLMQKKTPIYRWALRDTQTDYNVENMCVCVCGFHSVCASKKQILWQLCPDHPPSPESPAALSVLVCLHIPQCVWQLGQTTRLTLLTVRR